MTIEQRITNIQEMLPGLMEEALLQGIAIGYRETMKVMEERYHMAAETEETEETMDIG